MDPLPAPIAWGRHYEAIAAEQYVAHMKIRTFKHISQEMWLIIDPERGWFGASPDGKVKDLGSEQPDGVIEVKCPYSK